MAQFKSSNIKQVPTWLILLKEQKLASEYTAFAKKASNAPNMVKNFVNQLKKEKNFAQYSDFLSLVEQLIEEGKVCQEDLAFFNETFGSNYYIGQKFFASDSEGSHAKGKQAADLPEQQSNIKVTSKTIKQVETWISLLKTQSLASRYDQFVAKADNAPNMVKNFVRQLKKDNNEAKYNAFKAQIEQLIENGQVCQQDLDFINDKFELDYRLDAKSEVSEGSGNSAFNEAKPAVSMMFKPADAYEIISPETFIEKLENSVKL